MFSMHRMSRLAGVLGLWFAMPAAHAQWAVIDVASIQQLVQEVTTLQQQLATAKSQLEQAKTEYSAITGVRGMQNLLSGINRNYLPASWDQVQGLGGAGYGALGALYQTQLTGNAILTPQQVATLSPSLLALLNSARQNAALSQALSRTAFSTSSQRFTTLQQLITAIPSAQDQKGVLDLQARIAAEQTMLANDQSKLTVLGQALEAEERARAQRVREQVVTDVGSFRQLPPMGLASAIP